MIHIYIRTYISQKGVVNPCLKRKKKCFNLKTQILFLKKFKCLEIRRYENILIDILIIKVSCGIN